MTANYHQDYWFDSNIHKRRGANLPHWTKIDSWYAVTFRLWDSVPQSVLRLWLLERRNIVETARQMNRPLSLYEQKRLDYLFSQRIERFLDTGFGCCFMKSPRIADIVADAMQHFDNVRYNLAAWCVMPNHAHAVVKPFVSLNEGDNDETAAAKALSRLLHSCKSYTAKESNKVLDRCGSFWQEETYDHLIRNRTDFVHQVNYVLDNPAKAGLINWTWVGRGKI